MIEITALAMGAGGVAALWGGVALFNRQNCPDELERFRSTVDNFSEGIYRASMAGIPICANPSLVKLCGYNSEQELLSCESQQTANWYVKSERRDEFRELLLSNGRVEGFVSEITLPNTRGNIWISENAQLFRNKKGEPLHYDGSIRELRERTRRSEIEQRLPNLTSRLEIEQRLQKLSGQVPGGLFQFRRDTEGKFSLPYHSVGLDTLIGPFEEGVEEDAGSLLVRIHSDDHEKFFSSAKNSMDSDSLWVIDFRLNDPNREERWISLKGAPEIELDGSCTWHGFVTDVTEQKRNETRIFNLAFFDPLTSLPNRRLILDRLSQALQTSSKRAGYGAVLFIDLDNFKTLNDSMGHAVGDNLLVGVANRLRECMTSAETVGRFGGDEFVILIEELGDNAEKARQVVETIGGRILAAFDRPFRLGEDLFHTTPSVGATLFEGRKIGVDKLLQRADLAMYDAKSAGRNTLRFFDEEMHQPVKNQLKLTSEIRVALERNEFSIHLQPQMDLMGKIVGAEALIRWETERLGSVSPAQFIPVAEKSGAIHLINDWVMQRSLTILGRWQASEKFKDLSLSINVSPQQFQMKHFVSDVLCLAEHHKIDPKKIIIELTEHVMTGDTLLVAKKMNALKKAGVCFSLDDFGTGYSSLAQLKRLPFDEVKIDGSFVRDIETSDSDRSIVQAIIAMAGSLNLTTVAECVENTAQQEFLSRNGATMLQGFLFSKAVELSEFEKLVDENRCEHSLPVEALSA